MPQSGLKSEGQMRGASGDICRELIEVERSSERIPPAEADAEERLESSLCGSRQAFSALRDNHHAITRRSVPNLQRQPGLQRAD